MEKSTKIVRKRKKSEKAQKSDKEADKKAKNGGKIGGKLDIIVSSILIGLQQFESTNQRKGGKTLIFGRKFFVYRFNQNKPSGA